MIALLTGFVITLARAQDEPPCGPLFDTSEWTRALEKIKNLDAETLAGVAEQLAHSHASTPLDDRAFADNAFFNRFPARATPTVRINYDLLRKMPLALTDAEIGLLAALLPEVPRHALPPLHARVFDPQFDDFIANTREVLARDEYRLALVELLKRGVEPAVLVRNVRLQNQLMGASAPNPNFTRADLKASLKRILKKDQDLKFLVTISQMVEAVIMEINAWGRAHSAHFGEDPFSLQGNVLHTMVRAAALQWCTAAYFREVVTLTSPPHALRALVNTFGNLEPLPMPASTVRRQIAAVGAQFAAELARP